jgi:hypothetical protein
MRLLKRSKSSWRQSPKASKNSVHLGRHVLLHVFSMLSPLSFCYHSGVYGWFFSFMIILQTVGLLQRVISSSQGLYLNTGQHEHRRNAYTHQTSMPCSKFEPTVPSSKWAKTVHALDHSTTVTGCLHLRKGKLHWGKLGLSWRAWMKPWHDCPWVCVGRTLHTTSSSTNLQWGFDEASPYLCLIHPTSFWEPIDDLLSQFHGHLQLCLYFARLKEARYFNHPEDHHFKSFKPFKFTATSWGFVTPQSVCNIS